MACDYDCGTNWKWNLDDSRKAATLSILRLDCFIYCQFLKKLSSYTTVLVVVSLLLAMSKRRCSVEAAVDSFTIHSTHSGVASGSDPRRQTNVIVRELTQMNCVRPLLLTAPGSNSGQLNEQTNFPNQTRAKRAEFFFAAVYSCLVEAKKQHSVAALVQTHWLCGMTDFWHGPTPAITVCFWWNMAHFTNPPLLLASASFVS